ncbi:hypothetical protein K9N68_07185 [Kovacikia minuta CCNUW1]|uniref:hypothetical protein n=1 Tax=Kovacikia minuta TaxID=2931930 RepID=UPI001CCA342D|nr:hypothetical protein [Kovacikia minuta]UBF27692.1 hypothetical protein K9N68_07185 [Kovacikia minuta CCNUW1]
MKHADYLAGIIGLVVFIAVAVLTFVGLAQYLKKPMPTWKFFLVCVLGLIYLGLVVWCVLYLLEELII